VYADLCEGDSCVRSALGLPGIRLPLHENSRFGERKDGIYFIRTHVLHRDRALELRFGFDERPTRVAIAQMRRLLLWTLGICFVLSTLASLLLSYLLARPRLRLERFDRQLRTATRLLPSAFALHNIADDPQHARDTLATASRKVQHRERLETVGAFAGGIAHEFNNLLVPITLLSDFVLKKLPANDGSRSDLKAILVAARYARALVAQILAFSREKHDLNVQPLDLCDVVTEALRLFTPLISNGVRLEVELSTTCPPVLADRTLALQLVMNLCRNGYQSLGGASGVLKVAVQEAVDAVGSMSCDVRARHVELSIQDSGRGMDSKTLERIFEPFFTTRSETDGTGLGLTVVRGIVESFGATIQVHSVRGSGSTFRVLFPVSSAMAAAS
ncbi:MAG TPA: ATP-binding protein, partial [Candidatus Acidoferrum sp.]